MHRFGRRDTDAPTLLLMHGLTDSGRCWPDAVRRWQDDYRVLAWDARGHGESERFTDDELAAGVGETALRDAVDLLESLAADGIERPVLIGHSMGGGTAAAVAGHRPDLVRAALLEDPALGSRDDDLPKTGGVQDARNRVADHQATRDDPGAALRQGRRDNPSWPECEFSPWLDAKLQTDPRVLADPVITVRTPRLEVAAAVAAPTLVVTGGTGVIVHGTLLRRLRAIGNPWLSFEVVDGAGHCVRRSRVDGYHAVVDPWLAKQFVA